MVCMHVLSAIISFVLTSAGSQLQPSSSSVWWSAGSDWLAYSAVWSVQSGRTGYNPKIRRYKNSMSAEDTILLNCGKNNIHTERRGMTVTDVLYTFIYTRSITKQILLAVINDCKCAMIYWKSICSARSKKKKNSVEIYDKFTHH